MLEAPSAQSDQGVRSPDVHSLSVNDVLSMRVSPTETHSTFKEVPAGRMRHLPR